MFKTIEEYNEPLDILDYFQDVKDGTCGAEMGSKQLGFLCGLIKKRKPKKVLEIGVAGGGTTSVILNCIDKLGLDTEVISVDLAEKSYYDQRKRVGYLLDRTRDIIPAACGKHMLLTGKVIAEHIEEIASDKDIDFLILDTAHSLPGELLDFITCLPYLNNQGATVVLHDIMLNHFGFNTNTIATKILFDVVKAEKYFLWNPETAYGCENIGAFDITEDTVRFAEDLFSALTNTWAWVPSAEELKLYRDVLQMHYDEECMKMFDLAVDLQRRTALRDAMLSCYGSISELRDAVRKWKKAKQAVIYGCGRFGRIFLEYARMSGLRVDAMVVSDHHYITNCEAVRVPIYYLSELPYSPDECSFIIAVQNQDIRRSIEKNLRYAGYHKII